MYFGKKTILPSAGHPANYKINKITKIHFKLKTEFLKIVSVLGCLDKLNFIRLFNFRLEPIYFTAPSASKSTPHFKSGQK